MEPSRKAKPTGVCSVCNIPNSRHEALNHRCDQVVSGRRCSGIVKSAGFAIIIVTLACYEGLKVRGGAEEVGRSTTSTVVFTIIAVIAFDVIFTTIFYYVT